MTAATLAASKRRCEADDRARRERFEQAVSVITSARPFAAEERIAALEACVLELAATAGLAPSWIWMMGADT